MRICVIGLGQIGGSLASALKRKGKYVYAISRREKTIEHAIKEGIVDDGDTEMREPIDFDVVFLAVHLSLYENYMKRLSGFSGILSDVGSVKRTFYELARRNVSRFVGCHPVAGTEKSGVLASDPEIFKDKYCIIAGWSDEGSKKTIASLWSEIGARVVFMSPKAHDRLLSAISHLPHVIAFSVVNSTYGVRKKHKEIFGGSYRDITRVAASPAEMWADILVSNSDYVAQHIRMQINEMKKLMLMIKGKRRDRVLKYILNVKKKL